MPLRQPFPGSVVLRTGQTTQYNDELDDGHYERGLVRSGYVVLTAGQYDGTTNIDLVHYSAATLALAATTPGTITDSADGLALFKTGDVIVISGSTGNDGVYTVSTGNVAGTIRTTEATLAEDAGATISIAKREAHANTCVLDAQTALMWSQYTSSKVPKMGLASDGKMPWTGAPYDIFAYAAAANAAGLAGYADWRVPNVMELLSIELFEAPNGGPNATAFPDWPTGANYVHSATTRPNSTTSTLAVNPASGYLYSQLKTAAWYAALVRGGI